MENIINYENKIREVNDGFVIDFMKYYRGRRIHIYKSGFSSKDDALKELPIIIEKRIQEFDIIINPTFDRFLDIYQEYRANRVSKSTLLVIDTLRHLYLKDLLERPISDVFINKTLLPWYQNLIRLDNICDKWKNRILGEMRLMADFAFKRKYITSDDCLDSKALLENIRIHTRRKEKKFYTLRQLKRFLNVIDDEDDKDMFVVFSYLGARLSEFIGLTWDCFDSINKTIEIKQQIIYLKEKRPILMDTLKTKESYRFCKLNDETFEILKRRKQQSGGKGFIFPKDSDHPLSPLPKTTFRNRMEKYMQKAHLPIISAHGFRHTKATLLMSVSLSMADIKAAARFLGHSVTMMMETYAHEDKKNTDALIKRLNILMN
ncbi:MAG: site-specific integrase [Bacilli bacterium]|nr:site-specific integrase [Bacilli bacterium]